MSLTIGSDGSVSGGTLGSNNSSSSSGGIDTSFLDNTWAETDWADTTALVESINDSSWVNSPSAYTNAITPTYGGYTTDEIQAAIQSIYGDVLGREADPLGLSTYTAKAQEQLASGVSAEDIIAGFTNEALGSQEYADRMSAINETVTGAYTDILGRSADTSGLDYWTNELAGGNISSVDFLDAFNNAAQAELNTVDSTISTGGSNADKVYYNDLGQSYTMSDVNALGTKDDSGATLIGNAANRVTLDDGSQGYLIGTGNNRDGTGYNLSDTNYVAQGLLSPTPTYTTPTPIPTAVDKYIPNPAESLNQWYTDIFSVPLHGTNPDYFTTGWTTPSLTPSAILDKAISSGSPITDSTFGSIKTTPEFFDAYTQNKYGIPYNDAAATKYGLGPEGYNNFIGAAEAAQANGSNWFSANPRLALAKDGTVLAEDPASIQGILTAVGAALGNSVLGRLGGDIIGSMVAGMTSGIEAPLFSSMIGEATIKGYGPISATALVDENGERYIQSSFFGQTTVQKVSDIKPQTFFESSNGGQATEMTPEEKAAALLEKANAEPDWRDYRPGLNLEGIIGGAVIGSLSGGDSDLINSGLEAIEKYALEGMNPVDAILSSYAGDIAKLLPEGYDTLTESAARIILGENPIDVLGEKYGSEVGLDGPAGIAAIKGAVALDTGKDPAEALAISAYHYFKNGGEIPSWDVPSMFEGVGVDFNVDLGFIEDAAKSAIEYLSQFVPDMPSIPEGVDLGLDIPFKEWWDTISDAVEPTINAVRDAFNALIDAIPEIDITIPDGFPKIDVSVPEIDPTITGGFPTVDNPFGDINLELPKSTQGSGDFYYSSFDYVDPFKQKLGISEIDPVKYSQILLQNARKV